jgi:hypothetical protein
MWWSTIFFLSSRCGRASLKPKAGVTSSYSLIL